MYITDQNWQRYYLPLLRILTKRYNPFDINFHEWATIINPHAFRCKICKENIITSDLLMSDSLTEHGIFHLKERNLLPFL